MWAWTCFSSSRDSLSRRFFCVESQRHRPHRLARILGETSTTLSSGLRRRRRLVPSHWHAVSAATLSSNSGGKPLARWTGTYNWLEIVNGSSYFEKQSPLLLTNMWSLAVEQQFYLFWPLGLLLIIRYLPRRYAPYVTLGLGVALPSFCTSFIFLERRRHPGVRRYRLPFVWSG